MYTYSETIQKRPTHTGGQRIEAT